MRVLEALVTRRPRLVMALVALLFAAGVAAVALGGLRTDNGVERFMVKGDDAWRAFQDFRRRFGSGETLVLALRLERPPDGELIDELEDLCRRLRAADESVASRHGSGESLLSDVSGLHQFPRARTLAREGRGPELASLPFVSDLYLTGGGKGGFTHVLADLRAGLESGRVGELLDALKGELARAPSFEKRVLLAGEPVLNVALDRASAGQARTLFPLLAVVCLLLLWWFLGSLRGTLLVAATALLSIVTALAALVVSGRTLNMMTTALPALLLVLSSAACLHVYRAYALARARLGTAGLAAGAAVRETSRPCALAALTTAIGFLALTTSSVEPIREMGIFAAVGVAAGWLGAVVLLPAALALGAVPARREGHRALPGWLWPRRPGVVLAVTATAVCLAAAGIPRIGVESSALRFLPASHAVVRAAGEIRAAGRGLSSVEILARAPRVEADGAMPLARLAELGELARRLREVPGVTACSGLQDALAPGAGAGALALQRPELLRRFLDRGADGVTARLHLDVLPYEFATMDALVGRLRAACASFGDSHPDTRIEVTGIAPIMIGLHGQLIRSQVTSLLLAVLLVGAVMLLGLRSWRLSLIGAIPNLVPLAVIYGFLGWAGMRLDVATVMVGAIALGIAVDNTVHVLSACDPRLPRERAVHAALDRVWWPVLSTSVVAASGFAVLAVSDFAPMTRFGVITAAVMALAAACDMLLLPALLRVLGPFRRLRPAPDSMERTASARTPPAA